MRNLIPGAQIDCFSDTSVFRVAATLIERTLPTVNLTLAKGERLSSGGVSLVDSPMNLNIQLSEFELTEFAAVLIGITNNFKVTRQKGFIEMKRQSDPNSSIARLYVVSRCTGENRGLAIPILANRIFYISALVINQLQALCGGLSVDVVMAGLNSMRAQQ
jgi:hypothetical protein